MEHLILILRKHLNMLKCTMKELEEINMMLIKFQKILGMNMKKSFI